jgi:DNA repair exonuclease SbcCD nuclease subunit
VKILHTADWHLRDQDIEEARKCLSFMVEHAAKEGPDLIVIAGDIFDARGVKMESPTARLAFDVVSWLAELAPIVGVLGTASHDGDAPRILSKVRSKHQVIFADKPMQVTLQDGHIFVHTLSQEHSRPFAVISLVPQPTKQFYQGNGTIGQADQDISRAMAGIFAGFGAKAAEDPSAPHILVGHFQVAGSRKSEKQVLMGNDIEITRGQLDSASADLVCLGHIHYPQQVYDGCFYSGSIYAKDYGEIHPHGFFIHTFSKGELDSRPEYHSSDFIETPTRKLVNAGADFTTNARIEDADKVVAAYIDEKISGDVKDAVVRVEYRVWQDEAGEIDREKITQAYLDAGAESVEIRIVRVPRESVRSEAIIHCKTLREKLIEMARLRTEEVPETILAKADMLEAEPAEKIMEGVA